MIWVFFHQVLLDTIKTLVKEQPGIIGYSSARGRWIFFRAYWQMHLQEFFTHFSSNAFSSMAFLSNPIRLGLDEKTKIGRKDWTKMNWTKSRSTMQEFKNFQDWETLHWLSEILASLSIMGEQLRVYLKPPDLIVLWYREAEGGSGVVFSVFFI